MKFEGQRPQRTTRVRQKQVTGVDDKGDPDLLDDAIQDPLPEDEDSEEVVLDENWEEGDATIDERAANPRTAFRGVNLQINLNGFTCASPAKYFLHFLPCDHIQQVVLPALNYHASNNESNWIALDWAKYLT